jgi:broad specificity phosphatase PhoE
MSASVTSAREGDLRIQEAMRTLRRGFLLDDPEATEIWLVRHADAYEQPLAEDGVFDPGLSPLGWRQAERLAERLAAVGVQALYTSDARRAVETAAPVERRLGLTARVLADLRELRLTPGDGAERSAVVVQLLTAARTSSATDQRRPWTPAEAPAAAARRMAAVVDVLVARYPGRRVVAVIHGAAILAYLAAVLGIAERLPVYPEYTGISIIRGRGERRVVVSINDTAHLHQPASTPA